MKKSFINFIPFAVAIFFIFGGIFGATQQSLRMTANDMPLQLAQDGAQALRGGDVPASLVRNDPTVDIGKSSAPFVMVIDDKGFVLESSGVLDNKPLTVPQGVFDRARLKGENVVTWQPREGVRIALAVDYVQNVGFVLAGQSLQQTESHTHMLFIDLYIGGLFTWLVTFLAILFVQKKRHFP